MWNVNGNASVSKFYIPFHIENKIYSLNKNGIKRKWCNKMIHSFVDN